MKFIPTVTLACLLAVLTGCTSTETPSSGAESPGRAIIAFGSCLRQWDDQPVWGSINAFSPEAFIFLGDNMYSDVGGYLDQPEPERIGNAYRDLAGTSAFADFLRIAKEQDTALYATWDDHDYGINDGGGDYPHKLASKEYFLEFFGIDETATGDAGQSGIYDSHRLEMEGLNVQLILLDTRSFRSPLKKSAKKRACPPTSTVANTDPGATVLGEAQWRWLETELSEPADLRIIASSIQVIPEQHCFEKWANFPRERERLFDLIRKTQAEGVLLISGDRHLAEISKLPAARIGYPLYEITSSGLNSAMGPGAKLTGEKNRHRAGENLVVDNFGSVSVSSGDSGPSLSLSLHRADGEIVHRLEVPLNRLEFR